MARPSGLSQSNEATTSREGIPALIFSSKVLQLSNNKKTGLFELQQGSFFEPAPTIL
jgi:hypothetical protein